MVILIGSSDDFALKPEYFFGHLILGPFNGFTSGCFGWGLAVGGFGGKRSFMLMPLGFGLDAGV
jgi:hypothetical protein